MANCVVNVVRKPTHRLQSFLVEFQFVRTVTVDFVPVLATDDVHSVHKEERIDRIHCGQVSGTARTRHGGGILALEQRRSGIEAPSQEVHQLSSDVAVIDWVKAFHGQHAVIHAIPLEEQYEGLPSKRR